MDLRLSMGVEIFVFHLNMFIVFSVKFHPETLHALRYQKLYQMAQWVSDWTDRNNVKGSDSTSRVRKNFCKLVLESKLFKVCENDGNV